MQITLARRNVHILSGLLDKSVNTLERNCKMKLKVKLHFECFTLIYDCKVLIRQIILSDYATVSNNCTMSSRNLSFTFIN